MKPDGTEAEQVTGDDNTNSSPHVSPDGKSVAFLSETAGQASLKILSDGLIRTVATFEGDRGSFSMYGWGDHHHLAFISYQTLPTLEPTRPPIAGVSHIAVYAADPGRSERFYVHDLGAVKGPDPENPAGTRYYFSSTQFVEVLPMPASANRLDHVAFTTTDVEALREYLHEAEQITTGGDGSQRFTVKDPEGNRIEFVQPGTRTPDIRTNSLSSHIIHVGFIIHDRAREDEFFKARLGFRPDAAAALAAASRVLRGYDDALAEKCLSIATRVWKEEHSHPPVIFKSFNTTGGELEDEEAKAAVELVITTRGEQPYKARLQALLPAIQKNFIGLGWLAARALPYMDAAFKKSMSQALTRAKAGWDAELAKNPFGVPINTGTWGGSGTVAGFAASMYYLHQAFPDIVGVEATLRGFDYVLGRHPANNVSYVSSVGTTSKLVAYGNNRADYTFIPGGMIPGVVIIQPDFPELKDHWPFLWYENEYVVDAATVFILAANAAESVAH